MNYYLANKRVVLLSKSKKLPKELTQHVNSCQVMMSSTLVLFFVLKQLINNILSGFLPSLLSIDVESAVIQKELKFMELNRCARKICLAKSEQGIVLTFWLGKKSHCLWFAIFIEWINSYTVTENKIWTTY